MSEDFKPVVMGRLKKETARINLNGQFIDPKTKVPIAPIVEPEYQPTPEEVAILASKKGGDQRITEEELQNTAPVKPKRGRPVVKKEEEKEETGSSALGDMISKKIEEKVNDAIGKALGNLDIEGLVSKAIEKALK